MRQIALVAALQRFAFSALDVCGRFSTRCLLATREREELQPVLVELFMAQDAKSATSASSFYDTPKSRTALRHWWLCLVGLLNRFALFLSLVSPQRLFLLSGFGQSLRSWRACRELDANSSQLQQFFYRSNKFNECATEFNSVGASARFEPTLLAQSLSGAARHGWNGGALNEIVSSRFFSLN